MKKLKCEKKNTKSKNLRKENGKRKMKDENNGMLIIPDFFWANQ